MIFLNTWTYNLDVLNLMNVLTFNDSYVKRHREASRFFKENLSRNSRECIEKAVTIADTCMLGPFLCLVVSAVPDFLNQDLLSPFSEPDSLFEHFSGSQYYEEKNWLKLKPLFDTIVPVLRELEDMHFSDYWQSERLPLIEKYKDELSTFVTTFRVTEEIEFMLGSGSHFKSITAHICTYAAPHGIRLCGPHYITDIAFSKEATVATAIHEMFHPPFDLESLELELKMLGEDPLMKHAFVTMNPHGYSDLEGFIEENIVEAMALFVCGKIGLKGEYEDPFAYLKTHDGGSHVLSFILLHYFEKYPKLEDESFEEYFRRLLQVMPVGSLCKELPSES